MTEFAAGSWNGIGNIVKTGIFGGTFDPIHSGHLGVAAEVKSRLGLTEIMFVPAGQPWLNKAIPVAAAEHRYEMVRIAIADKSYFKLSRIEIDRAGPSYTVDTIAEVQGQPGSGSEIFFILGWDNLMELHMWREPSRLIKMCRLVAVHRPGVPRPDLNALEAGIPGISRRVIIMDKPVIDISASEIRDRAARGLAISHLVPGVVASYIKRHKLYINQ